MRVRAVHPHNARNPGGSGQLGLMPLAEVRPPNVKLEFRAAWQRLAPQQTMITA
jgi:hypothetical protein